MRIAPLVVLFFVCITYHRRAFAYSAYTVQYGVNSCTACHLNPVGGGPRTVYGKLFGTHNFEPNKLLEQDYVSADFRLLYYHPEKAKSTKGGLGLMSGSVAGHAALDEHRRVHLVIDHNIAGFAAAALRDTYALFRLSPDNRPSLFSSLLVGRFRAPFGIVTDEHRTYARIQTATEWFTFETGALLSGDPLGARIHYDVAVVNGEKNPGQTLIAGQANLWGTIANIRWLSGPILLGISASYHRRDPANQSARGSSIYTIFSLGQLTKQVVPLTLELEYSEATGWNNNLGRGFASSADYVKSLERSRSAAWLALLEWAFSNRLIALYKFDYLTPDRKFPADYYQRHGVGIRWVVAPNVIIQARSEVARATHPSERGGTGVGAQNANFALLQLAF